MALFVPQWPSVDNTDRNVGIDSEKCSNEKIEGLINGTSDSCHGASPSPRPPAPPAASAAAASASTETAAGATVGEGVDGIELTHDPLTGSVSVSSGDADGEGADESDKQCQMWAAAAANADESEAEGQGSDGVEISAGSSAFGDIWSTEAFAFNTASPLKELLDSGDYTLLQLLEKDELLQELRGCEARLVEYLSGEGAVAGLVECLMVEVPYSNEGSKRSRERWCAEEEDRRRRRRELREKQNAISDSEKKNSDSLDSPIDLVRSKSSVIDASSSNQEDDPNVEAKWNSPPKGPQGGWLLGSSPGRGAGAGKCEEEEEKLRPLEEEYDMRFVRYPYMACEVLCSEVGTTLDVLVDGYVDDIINDDEDSLLDSSTKGRSAELRETKMDDDGYGTIKVPLDDDGRDNINIDGDSIAGIVADATPNFDTPRLLPKLPSKLPLPSSSLAGVVKKQDAIAAALDTTPQPQPSGAQYVIAINKCTNERRFFTGKLDDNCRNAASAYFDHCGWLISGIQVSAGDMKCHQITDEIIRDGEALLSERCELFLTPPTTMRKPLSKPKRRILDLLFSVLLDTPPAALDDRRSGYFEKILNVLFRRRGQAMSDYMNTSLIVTTGSEYMAKRILSGIDFHGGDLPAAVPTGQVANGGTIVIGATNKKVAQSSSYVSLSHQMLSLSSAGEGDTSIGEGAIDQTCRFPSPDAPPMLMCALFDHLHSYSIMHIVQRLILPSPTRQLQNDNKTEVGLAPLFNENKKSSGVAEGENLSEVAKEDGHDDNPNSIMNDQFMNALSQMNANEPGGISPLSPTEDEDDEMEDDDDPANHIFQCDWSSDDKRLRCALELLLRRLEGDAGSFLVGYGYPVGYDVDAFHFRNRGRGVGVTSQGVINKDGGIVSGLKEQSLDSFQVGEEGGELALLCSQHASEILTTIIQNSSLDSSVVKSLSTTPWLERIIDLICPPSVAEEEGTMPHFVAHESAMTCAVMVLESLVLQLGGYGAVAPTGDGDSDGGEDGKAGVSVVGNSQGGRPLPSLSPLEKKGASGVSTLLRHTPVLLSRLSALLTHPAAEAWTAPSQYSRISHRPLLGTSRLRVLRLVESLVLLGDPCVDIELSQTDVLEKALELFWSFEWCSMLHQCVANLLVHVFEGGEGRAVLQGYILVRCDLLRRLMDSFGGEFIAVSSDAVIREDTVTRIPESCSKVTDCGARDESLQNGGCMVDEQGNDGAGPGYGEMMLAMKGLYGCEKGTPSVESERGSGSGSERDAAVEVDDAVAPVSEDDVDSAMEKECQDRVEAMSSGKKPKQGGLSVPTVAADGQISFRKGYMGHVIIICQALVHACNNANQDDNGNLKQNASKEQEDGPPTMGSPPSLDEISATSSFETSAVQTQVQDDSMTCNSKKRKDRSPVRDVGEDIKRLASSPVNDGADSLASPIPKVPSSPRSSPTHRVEVNLAQSPCGDADTKAHDSQESLTMYHIIRRHPLYDRWQDFVTSSLASEMSIQSTPLGGQQQAQAPTPGGECTEETCQERQSSIDASNAVNFVGASIESTQSCVGSGAIGGHVVVGEIDMDENDLDIAASMMEALSLPSNGGLMSSSQPVGHNRRRGVIGGGSSLPSSLPSNEAVGNAVIEDGPNGCGIGGFGSVIQRPGGFKDYVYDDPLGGVHPFDGGSEEEGASDTQGGGSAEDDGFMSDAMVVPRDGGAKKNNGNGVKKSLSSSSDELAEDEDEDDDDVPVIDFFAGSYEANFANFDAFESSVLTSDNGNPFVTGKENVVGAEDLFAAIDGNTSSATETDDDQFEFSKTPFDLVDSLTIDEGGAPKSKSPLFCEDDRKAHEEGGSS